VIESLGSEAAVKNKRLILRTMRKTETVGVRLALCQSGPAQARLQSRVKMTIKREKL